MNRFDGTAVRQLVLVDEGNTPLVRHDSRQRPRSSLRLLHKDIYAELARRRRRAQIQARHYLNGQ